MGGRARVHRLSALIAVMALVLAGCAQEPVETTTTTEAPSDTGTTTTTQADATTTTEAEAQGIAVGMGLLAPSGVPWTGAGSPGQYMWSSVFDALTYIDPDGTVAPALATEWTAVDDTTWEFTLREGVTFQNGEPLDAAAVVATFDTLLSEEGRATYSANVNNYGFVESVEEVDDMAVRVTTGSPNPLLPAALSIAYIVPPEYFADVGAEGFATAPIGSGPYMPVEWSDQQIVVEAWDGSWRGAPSIPRIEFLNLNDPAARVQALQSGQIQIAESIGPDQIGPLESEGFQIFSGTRGSVMSLAFIANEGGPLESTEVRQALNYAVDKQTIVEELLAGQVNPGVWPPQGVNGYDPSRDPYPYDPEMAAQLLADAGFADGFDMVAEVTVGSFPADADIYEAMAGYLSEVGVNVELRQIDFAGEWLPKFLGTEGADWEGDAFGLSWNAAPLMDGIRPYNFFSCGWTNEFFCAQDQEELVNEVSSTLDTGERNALLTQLLDMTKENPSALWLVVTPELWAYSPDVQGFSVDNFNIRFEDVTFGG